MSTDTQESIELAHQLAKLISLASTCGHDAVAEHLLAALEELCKAEQACECCLDEVLLSLASGTRKRFSWA